MSKKPLEDKAAGIHRAKLWEIGFYALNNASTNTYMILVGSISYFLIGIVGVGAVLAGSLITIMRIWDGCTDPFVGLLVDKTDSKFGKNRPFIVIGQILLFAMTFIMFRAIPAIPSGARFIVWLLIYMVYIIGYTFQCVVTKSAQSCLTNDPTQRPVFAMFDSIITLLLINVWHPIYLSGTLVPRFTLDDATAEGAAKIAELVAQNPNLANVLTTADGISKLSGFYNPEMWKYMQLVYGALSAVLAVLAIIGLWRKDRSEYFGLGTTQKISFRDYADVLAHNRGIQMLVVSASSDKLSLQMMTNATIYICLFGVIAGNYNYYASTSAIMAIPVMIVTLLGVNFVGRRLGQKKALIFGTWGAIVAGLAMLALWVFGNPSSVVLPTFSLTNPSSWGNLFSGSNWSIFGILYIVIYVLMKGFSSISSSIVIPMTADCADYEVYRTGRYVPGLMGTLFSFVDKLISSLATTVVALVYAAVGFSQSLPTLETPNSTGLFWATMFCFIGACEIGWILNIIAMKFYPLTKEKMEEIQDDIARIKAESNAYN